MLGIYWRLAIIQVDIARSFFGLIQKDLNRDVALPGLVGAARNIGNLESLFALFAILNFNLLDSGFMGEQYGAASNCELDAIGWNLDYHVAAVGVAVIEELVVVWVVVPKSGRQIEPLPEHAFLQNRQNHQLLSPQKLIFNTVGSRVIRPYHGQRSDDRPAIL